MTQKDARYETGTKDNSSKPSDAVESLMGKNVAS
jgi:hypothetical protein